MNPQSKPSPRPKAPRKPLRQGQPIKRTKRLAAKRWGVYRGPSKTKHGRRERDFARMGKLSALGECAVNAWLLSPRSKVVWLLGSTFALPMPCHGRLEVAHLSLGKTAGRRRAPDSQTAPICHQHHTDIDGKVGGKAPWYVALGYDGQQELRRWLIDWADAHLTRGVSPAPGGRP